MKRLLIIAIIFAAALTSFAQAPLESRLTDFKADDSTMKITYVLAGDQTVGSDYALCLTPFLCNAKGDSLFLDPIVFRGKRNMRYAERSRFYGSVPQTTASGLPLNATQQRELTLSRDRYPWLWTGRIKMGVRKEKEGCCNVVDMPQDSIGHFVYIPPFIPQLAYVEDNTGKAGELQKNNPVLQHISKYLPYDDTRILRKEEGALYVHFPVNSATLLHDFRDNALTLDRIEYITKAIMADTTSSVKIIQIIGLASVEGPQHRNSALAANRAEALKKYVQQKVRTPDSMYEAVNGGEAWTELRDQISDTDFEWRESLLAIIDSDNAPDRKERMIRALDGGMAYAYLKEHILKDQRNSGYVRIYYDYVPDTTAKVINEAVGLMKEEKYAEALALLEPVSYDKRSHSPLGVAYYMTNNEQKGMEYMQRAADEGNENARRNIEQIRKRNINQ